MLVVKEGQVLVCGMHEKLNSLTVKLGLHSMQACKAGSKLRQLEGKSTQTP